MTISDTLSAYHHGSHTNNHMQTMCEHWAICAGEPTSSNTTLLVVHNTDLTVSTHTRLSRKQRTGAHMYTVAISILPQPLPVRMYTCIYTCRCPPHIQLSSHYIKFTVPSTNTYISLLSSLFNSPNTYIHCTLPPD